MSEVLIEDTTYTLNGSITSTATSMAVTAVSGSLGAAPTSMTGQTFRARIDNEIVIVTATDSTGLTWTVTRGSEGTTGASHTSGATVAIILTAGAIAQIEADYCLEATSAEAPTASTAGRLYFSDAGNTIQRDTGTTWMSFGPVFPMTPPATTGWTSVNIASGSGTDYSVTYANGYPELAAASPASLNSLGLITVNAPSTPYNIDAAFLFTPCPSTGNKHTGLAFYDTVSGKVYTFTIQSSLNEPYSGASMGVLSYTAVGTFSSTPLAYSSIDLALARYMRIRNDGTNLSFWISADGTNWVSQYSVAIASSLTPNKVGFYICSNTGICFSRLIHWKQS